MTSMPRDDTEEEPQEERGAPGSRDTGSDEPAGGPVDRPAGGSDEETDTVGQPAGLRRPTSPDLPAGGKLRRR